MFVSARESVNFEGNTLVLPSLSIGNVGQLAIDLIVSTLSLPRVGYLDNPHVLPIVGNDSLDGKNGHLALNLEVFKAPSSNVTFLQQRAPVIKGRNALYAESLINWIKESSFKEVILLFSTDASHRVDLQLTGSQLRYLQTDSFQSDIIQKLGWLQLENISKETPIKKGTVTYFILDKCKSLGVPLLILIAFVSEGNNIPEGKQMATWLNQFNTIIPEGEGSISWKMPSSWHSLLEGPPLDKTLFL